MTYIQYIQYIHTYVQTAGLTSGFLELLSQLIIFLQDESGSALMSGGEQTSLLGVLSWDSDDIDSSSCEVSGLPSVFTNISSVRSWMRSVTNIKV